tara:strand:+ start:58 stop:807 length:750 start_codon:yes stop_codon:yes gene_type:complete
MLKNFLKTFLLLFKRFTRFFGFEISRYSNAKKLFPVHAELEQNGIEILSNSEFNKSCIEVKNFTLLDTPRLANLWMLSQLSDNNGAIIEIGSYKGGGAKHLCNANPERKVIVCDPFDDKSFQKIDTSVDSNFFHGQFSNTSYASVLKLLSRSNAEVIKGYFPNSVSEIKLPKISFVYLDVDVYQATLESLIFLVSNHCLLEKHIILLDDYNRNCDGIDKAVKEFLSLHPDYISLPLFPGQGVLIPETFF